MASTLDVHETEEGQNKQNQRNEGVDSQREIQTNTHMETDLRLLELEGG